MAQPSAYNRVFNFSNFQAANPEQPLPAGSLDEELSRIKAVFDQIRSNLALIQRDDTALANDSVGFDQLKSEISIGVNPPTTWVTSTSYIVRDSVFHAQKFYVALESHVSGTFDDDLAAGKWDLVADFTAAQAASLVTYDNATSGLLATDMQAAMDELVASVNVTSVFGRSGAVVATASDYDADQVDFDAGGLDHTDATDVQGAIADHDAAITTAANSVPTGTVLEFYGTTAPAGYLFPYGQTVSRTTYAGLFAVLGAAHGAGDGSTTFRLPDKRGRTAFGRDDMGGTAANRLTGKAGGIDGLTLGATGGSETHALTEAEMPAHTHGKGTLATDSAGSHAHNIPSGNDSSVGGTVPYLSVSVQNDTATTTLSGAHTHPITGATASAGSGDAHNSLPPGIVCNFIIKT